MRVVIVISIKGGTGKTITSIGIAANLSKKYKVGLIDADLESPNLAEILNISGELKIDKERRFIPIDYNGIEIMSMYPIIGNGSICKSGIETSQIIQDIILKTKWRPDTDYFVVDMSAGSSSDSFKTIRTLFGDKLLGAVVVTQPGNSKDVLRSIDLCSNNNLRILGLVENMSYFQVGKRTYYPFGRGTTEEISRDTNIEFFGEIPLLRNIRERAISGEMEIFDRIVKKIEELSKNV